MRIKEKILPIINQSLQKPERIVALMLIPFFSYLYYHNLKEIHFNRLIDSLLSGYGMGMTTTALGMFVQGGLRHINYTHN
ncbi:MAG: hypothetical protein Fur009_7540 [Candidatus Microgenomates bacterium]